MIERCPHPWLYALLCLVARVCVPALHAADVGAAGQTADASQQDRRDDTPAPHDHLQCMICHAGHGTPALPEPPTLEFPADLLALAAGVLAPRAPRRRS